MGMLDGILGGVVGAGVSSVVSNAIEQQGGLQGIVSKFDQNGLGDIAKSWVGSGSNLPVSAEQIQQVLGSDTVAGLAEKFGISKEELAEQVAKILPETVDGMTPGGAVEEVA